MSLPIERLSSSVEEDPETAEEWSEGEEKMAERYAGANVLEVDEAVEERDLEQILSVIKMDDPCPKGQE